MSTAQALDPRPWRIWASFALAELVCAQGLRANSSDPTAYNAIGVILAQRREHAEAVEAFDRARQLAPDFYEAHMNFAAASLHFRGFSQAEGAYRMVLKTRPRDYDARLGLALALRGQIVNSNFDALVKESAEHLATAKDISPDRPEAFYNEAILHREYRAKRYDADADLLLAKSLYEQFLAKAGSQDKYSNRVKRAKEQIVEIQMIVSFNEEAKRERAEAEREAEAAEREERADLPK